PRRARADALGAALNLRISWTGKPDFLAAADWQPPVIAADAYRDDLSTLDEWLQGTSLRETPIADLPAEFVRLARDPRRRNMPQSFSIRAGLDDAGLGPLLNELELRDDAGANAP